MTSQHVNHSLTHSLTHLPLAWIAVLGAVALVVVGGGLAYYMRYRAKQKRLAQYSYGLHDNDDDYNDIQ